MQKISNRNIKRFLKKHQYIIIQVELANLPKEEYLSRIYIPADFDQRMEELIVKYTQPQKLSHHTGRRIAVALLAALIAATVTVMSVSAAR